MIEDDNEGWEDEPSGIATKYCPVCKKTRPVTEFYRNRAGNDGYGGRCKQCSAKGAREWRRRNADRDRASSKRYNQRHPERRSNRALRRRYGITLDKKKEMFAEQCGKCAICGTTDPGGNGEFHVDHDHDTGEVRGLLCNRCNLGLGHLRDSVVLLRRAIFYLIRHAARRLVA